MHRQFENRNALEKEAAKQAIARKRRRWSIYSVYVNVTSIKISSFANGYIEFVVHFQLVVNLHVLFTVLLFGQNVCDLILFVHQCVCVCERAGERVSEQDALPNKLCVDQS